LPREDHNSPSRANVLDLKLRVSNARKEAPLVLRVLDLDLARAVVLYIVNEKEGIVDAGKSTKR